MTTCPKFSVIIPTYNRGYILGFTYCHFSGAAGIGTLAALPSARRP